MNEPIIISEYAPNWTREFERIRDRVLAALGDYAVAVEHVGSTAVPGLSAKPIIDLDVVIRSRADLAAVIERLTTLGYSHQGDLGIAGRESFGWPPETARHHMYVCALGNEELRRHLLFRDYLRAHPQKAQAYAAVKKRLAAKVGSDRDAYTEGKSKFIEEVLGEAGWTRGFKHETILAQS